MSGTVYLVGVGPGSRRHLTLRAAEIIARVTAVILPDDVPHEILADAGERVEVIRPGPAFDEVETLRRLASQHAHVARFYAGDPFLDNPGVTVAEALGAAGVAVEVVPGVLPAQVAQALAWSETLPLGGRTVAVTRPRDQSAAFVAAMEEAGARVVHIPLIRIVEPGSRAPLLEAARGVGRYDWVVFTSANGVTRFWDALDECGLDTRALGGVAICAIGPATAAALERHGARADLVPPEFVAESVAEALVGRGVREGTRVLLPRPEVAREVLPASLRRVGAVVDDIVAYRTVPDPSGVERLREELAAGTVDLVTFTSSSTVRSFAELVSRDPPNALVASIGPLTTATARELGWEVAIEAREHTTAGLAEAILEHYRGQRKSP